MKQFLVFLAFAFISSQQLLAQPQWSAYGGIPNGATKNCVIDGSGNKWVTMFGGGISMFKPDETYVNYNSANSDLPEDFTIPVVLDLAGNKWIGTNSSGVVMFDGTTWTTYNTSDGLAGNQINCIAVDNSDTKWIGHNLDGITKYDGTTYTLYNTGNSALPNDNVNCITIDSYGNKWIGTYAGLAKFDGSSWTVYTTGNSGLPHEQVYSVTFESPTIIWIGTGGGLCKFDGNSTWTTYNTGNSGLPYNYVNCVAIDQNNTKWIGTTQGGLAEFDGASSWTIYNTSNSNIPGMDIRDIEVDSDNNLWICSNGGFAFYGVVPEPGSDATLSELFVNGVSEPSFLPDVFYYSLELPYGTVDMPVLDATKTDPLATMTITDATTLPGFAYIEVTAEDGIAYNMYWIDFTVAASPSSDATLSDLKIDGSTVEGFSPSVFNYSVELPYGTTVVPTVDYITSHSGASATVSDASSLPGTSTVNVTAQDGLSTQAYSIEFTIAAPGTDASLSSLLVDGEIVTGFIPTIYDYFVELPFGTTLVPEVTAFASDSNAAVLITPAISLPGITSLTVTAEDGTTTMDYSVSFTVAAPSSDASLSGIYVDGNLLADFHPDSLSYDVLLDEGTVIVPTVTAAAADTNATVLVTETTLLPGITTIEVTAQDGSTILLYSVNFSLITGMTQGSEYRVEVFPNPTKGQVSVRAESGGWLTITDMQGRVIIQQELVTGNHVFDLSERSDGIYMFQILTKGNKTSHRIILSQD